MYHENISSSPNLNFSSNDMLFSIIIDLLINLPLIPNNPRCPKLLFEYKSPAELVPFLEGVSHPKVRSLPGGIFCLFVNLFIRFDKDN